MNDSIFYFAVVKVYSFFNTPCSPIAEIVSAHASGKIASLITVESGHSIGTSLAVLRMFHRLGARSLTLTHNCNTPWYVIIKVIFIRPTITISVLLLLVGNPNLISNVPILYGVLPLYAMYYDLLNEKILELVQFQHMLFGISNFSYWNSWKFV